MPIHLDRIDAICEHLERVASGEKPRPIDIGELTATQFATINAHRSENGLPGVESALLVYVGRHHYASRSQQGYTIQDMVLQLRSALSADSEVVISAKMTGLQNKLGREDGYGKTVKDLAVLELTVRKPKAEVYSVIPKGDGK